MTADWTSLPLWYHPLSVLIYLFVQDTCFYWSHRWMHRPKWFRLAHAVHHDSRPPTAWTAMSFHPIEAVTGAIVVPVLVFLVPIHVGMLGLVLTIATVMGVTNHMGWEMFPRWLVHSPLGNWLITASHHERHHEEYRCNYGLYFRFWDHLCGTDRGLAMGAPKFMRTWDWGGRWAMVALRPGELPARAEAGRYLAEYRATRARAGVSAELVLEARGGGVGDGRADRHRDAVDQQVLHPRPQPEEEHGALPA